MALNILVVLGFVLRLLFVNKAEGLWNDEYVSWFVSQAPLFHGFKEAVFSQCHMPFYYLYLKFFTSVFGSNDLFLRLLSVIPGVVSIWVMYLVGKTKSKKIGLICAGFCAINSFLIYYSQEVRFYSLLFLFSAFALLFTNKIVEKTNKKNLIGWIVSNLLVLITHTIGFVYVFFNMCYVSFKLFGRYKKEILYVWSFILLTVISISPLVLKIMTEKTFSQWWNVFTPAKIGFVFTDYFSPFLINLTASPEKFFFDLSPMFFIFCLIPAIICLGLVIKAIFKKENLELLLVAIFTLLVLVIASISGKLVLLTKYSIEIFPILILVLACGLESINNKYIKRVIVSVYVLLCCVYMIISPVSAFKIRRAEGHKIVADILKRAELENGDIVLLEYYPKDRFEKYFDFSNYEVLSINKGNFPEFMSSNSTYQDAYSNGKNIYRDVFEHAFNKHLMDKTNSLIFSNLKGNQSVAIVFLNSVSSYSDEEIQELIKDEKKYEKTPLMFLIFSHIKNQTVKNAMTKLPITYYERKGNWSVVKFTKVNK